jgi:hypothetical protein
MKPLRSGPDGATFNLREDGVASHMGPNVTAMVGTLLTTICVTDEAAGSRKRLPPYVAFTERVPEAVVSRPGRGQQRALYVVKLAAVAMMLLGRVELPAEMLRVPAKFTLAPSR